MPLYVRASTNTILANYIYILVDKLLHRWLTSSAYLDYWTVDKVFLLQGAIANALP